MAWPSEHILRMKSLCCIDSIGMPIVSLALRVRPLFLPLLFVAHCPTCVAETGRFLWFSDLHYDPFYGRDGAWLSRGAGCAFDDAPSDLANKILGIKGS